jgi:hypothetical protein
VAVLLATFRRPQSFANIFNGLEYSTTFVSKRFKKIYIYYGKYYEGKCIFAGAPVNFVHIDVFSGNMNFPSR